MENAQGAPGCEDEHLELKDIPLEQTHPSVISWWDSAWLGAPSRALGRKAGRQNTASEFPARPGITNAEESEIMEQKTGLGKESIFNKAAM